MSYHSTLLPDQPALGTDLTEVNDPSKLTAFFEQASAKHKELVRAGCVPDSTLSDEANAENHRIFDDQLRLLIRRQIDCITKLRKTSTGPAKAGGKRAKKAPVDLKSLEDAIFS